jgi:hypothetical protein
MQDREQYRQILGIEAPWFVERVDLKLAEGEVHSRFTALMEPLVIDWLRAADISQGSLQRGATFGHSIR